MRPDAEYTRRTPGRQTIVFVAVLLTLALALVTPASGPTRAGAHDFVSVHLIFPHHHDADVGHGPATGDDRLWDGALGSLGQPGISAAGAFADAASLASKGLAMAGFMFALALSLRSLGGALPLAVPPQRWDLVPLRPPR